jgi:DNA-binding SARP family transcriptional activator
MAERAHVDIRVLGPIAAFRNDEAAALGGPRQRAVLARLALVAGQVVTADRLIDDVWSGEPPPTATNTLQSYVSLLRRSLGAADLIRREGPGYVLDIERGYLDANRFEDAVGRANRVLTDDPATALDVLDGALGEWRGPCLVDVRDEEWARPAVARWDELRLSAIECRFDALLALGRAAEAATGLERTADEHPLREGLVRRLMLALYRAGRQADALRAFTRTRTLLGEELGLDPSPALQALQLAILDHDPSLANPAPVVSPPTSGNGAAAPSPAPSPTPTTPTSSGARRPSAPAAGGPGDDGPDTSLPLPAAVTRAAGRGLVGRDAPRAALGDVWETVVAGEPRLAVISGEAGTGKSTLAAHVAMDVHARGGTVLWGRAAQEAIVPFEPLVQALRTALHGLSPRARTRVIDDRSALAVLLPELPQLVPTMRVERPSPDVERYVLFETVADLLAVESAGRPILLVVDDVQWADSPTVKLLEHLVRHERRSRVMILATQRVPSEDTRVELDRLLMGLVRDGELTRVELGPLEVDDVGALLRMAGRSDSLATDLRAATDGNAFFVTELIATGGGLDRWTGELPDSVRTMINGRLDRLPAASAKVVSLAAVAGTLATLPVLVAATELDADEVLDAADVAVAAGLLREASAGRLVTPHALTRHAVLARFSGLRLNDLHRRVGRALAVAAGSEVSAGEIAHHLLAAGALVERSERLAAAIAAGEEAMRRVAYEDAMSWVQRADELAAGTPDPLAVDVALLESAAQRALGDRIAARTAAQEAADRARSLDDAIGFAKACEAWVLSMAGIGFEFGTTADPVLVAALVEAIEHVPDDAVDHQVWLRSMLVSVLLEDDDETGRREALSEEALAIAARTNDPGIIASALHGRRLAVWRRDRLEERLSLSQQAVAHAHRAGDVHLELTSMLVAMADLLEDGQVGEQLAMLERFRERAATLRTPLYDTYTDFLYSCRLVVTGDYEEARRIADAALARGLAAHGISTEMAHAGQLFCRAWDHDELGALVDVVAATADAHPDFTIWRVALVGCLVAAGRQEQAAEVLAELVTPDGVHLRDNSMYFTAACFLVEGARALGDRVRAGVLLETLRPYVGRVAISGLGGVGIGPVRRYVGVAAHVTGDLDGAVEQLELALEESTRHGMRPFAARAHRDLAAALEDRAGPRDIEAAARHRERATALAAEIGLVLGRI